MAVDVGSATGYLDLDISGFLANLRTAQSETESASRNMAAQMGQSLQSVGSAMTSAGQTFTAGLTVPIVSAVSTSVKQFANLEQSIGGIETLFKNSAQTVISSAESAYSRAGVDANNYMEQVTSFSATLLSNLGGDTVAAAEYADRAIVDMSDNANKMGTSIDIISQTYQSLARGNYAMLDNLKLGYGGTKSEMERMIADANRVKEANGEMADLSIDSFADVTEAIHIIQTELGITGTTAKEAESTVTGSFGMMKSSVLNFLQQLGNPGADMDKFAQAMIDSIGIFVDNVKRVLSTIWDNLPISDLQKKLLVAAAAFGPVLLAAGKVVSAVGSIITKANGAIPVIKNFASGFSSAGTTMAQGAPLATKLGAAIGGISAPVVAVVAVIGTLIAAFANLWKTNEEFRNNIIGIWNEIKDTLSGFFDGIVERLNALGFDFENIMDVLKAAWDAFCSLLAPVFEGVFQIISNILKTVTGVLTGILDVFIGLFTGNWDQFLQGIKGIFESIWNGIVSFVQTIWNTIVGLLDAFLNLFGTNIENVMTSISNFFQSIWNGIKSFFGNLWENLKSIVSTAIKAIQNTITNILNAIVTFWQNIWNGIKTFASTVWNSVKSVITSTFNAIKGTIENILNGISTTWSNIWNGIKSAVSTIWNGIKSVVSGAINSVKSTVRSILGMIQNIWSNGWNTVKNTLSNAWENIKTGVSKGIDNVVSFVKDLPGKILDALGDVGSLLLDAGKSIINGFLDGLKSAWDSVTGWIGGIGDWIAEHKGPEDYDKKLLVPAGNWIMEGLGKGLGEGFEGVKDQVSCMGNDIVNSFDVSEIPVGFEFETTKLPEVGVKTFKDTIKSVYNDVALWFESIEARINGSIQRMTESLAGLISQGSLIVNSDGTLGYIGYNGFTRIPTSNDDNCYGGSDRDNKGGGDTFIFNSPKAIDEIEAARQMKQTKRDIAEGF